MHTTPHRLQQKCYQKGIADAQAHKHTSRSKTRTACSRSVCRISNTAFWYTLNEMHNVITALTRADTSPALTRIISHTIISDMCVQLQVQPQLM